MQSVIATDGNVSFAILLYENTNFTDLGGFDLVGFASGDGSSAPLRTIEDKNVYRIDGKSK